MFCPNCGEKITEAVSFCPECGAQINNFNTQSVQQAQNNVASVSDNVISDKYLWGLAFAPEVLCLLLESFVADGLISEKVQMYTSQGLCMALIYCDWRMLKDIGKKQSTAMLIVGFLLPLVYLFWRPYKTTKNYLPGILSCVLTVIWVIVLLCVEG